jgi:hypothetical protein
MGSGPFFWSHDVIRVGMREDDGVNQVDLLAKTLDAQLRRGIDEEFDLAGFNIDRGAGAVVFWIGEEGFWIFPTDDRHAGGSAAAQEYK